jgi:hypothetical protein
MEIEQLLHKYNDYIQSLPGEHRLTAVNFIIANSDCDLDTIKHHVELTHATE